MEEAKWRKRREWKKRSGEARWGNKGCGKCYREDRGAERGGHWNVEVFLVYLRTLVSLFSAAMELRSKHPPPILSFRLRRFFIKLIRT